MKRFASIFAILLPTLNLYPSIHWPTIVEEIDQTPSSYHLTPIHGGASNINYRLDLKGSHYFYRYAPPEIEKLYADMGVEFEVLRLLSHMEITSKPLYYDSQKRIMITDYIEHDDVKIDLLDSKTRIKVFALLHQIENSQIKISRVFRPYEFVMQLVGKADPFPKFRELLLPSLKQIDAILSRNPKKTLCHMDLHSNNILRSKDQFWIVDWEYTMMSHPLMVLASMAALEHWDDAKMQTMLIDYMNLPTQEDYYCLYLYRIVADIFWAAWDHTQSICSPIDSPYAVWGKLSYDAAIERICSQQAIEAMEYLEQRYSQVLINLR